MDEAVRMLGYRLLAWGVLVWTGWGRCRIPSRDEADLIAVFGADLKAALMPVIRELEDEFYASTAHLSALDLTQMGGQAADEFRVRHPDLPGDVAAAFAWCYTFDYK